MDRDDLDRLKSNIAGFTDDALIAMATINAGNYTPTAVEMAAQEIQRRGISKDTQKVLSDYFVNSNGYAGRLILLEEQLLFLSTGINYVAANGSGGLIGAMHDADRGNLSASATKLDFSALENEGSWIYYLDEIIVCEAQTSWFSGNGLTIQFKDEKGDLIGYSVKCPDLSKAELYELETNINEAKSMIESAIR